MVLTIDLFLFSHFLFAIVDAAHFRGGTITWRPLNSTPSGTSVQILIRQRYSWLRSNVACNDATIANKSPIGGGGTLECRSGLACPSAYGVGPPTSTFCTDYSAMGDVSSGERYTTYTIPLSSTFSVSFYSSAWFSTLVVGSDSEWSLTTRINTVLRPDGLINTSPLATTLPVIYKAINIQHVHVVQMSDGDADTVRCRWSTASGNINQFDECRGVCNGLPGAVLIESNCTLKFTLTQSGKYAAVALQIEDFYLPSSTTPLSSVSLQFLFYGYTMPTGCTTPPEIIGARPNRACIGTPIGGNVTEYVIAKSYCTSKIIVDFISSTPIGMIKSPILSLGSNTYQIILSWIPTSDQTGPQGFCAGAVDNTYIQSDQWCITFLVGFDSPDLVRPTVVQGSASPLGTIAQSHTIFSIQTTRSVGRPTRNGTYIRFKDATANSIVASFDCGWAPEVTFTGFTIVVRFPVAPWIVGHTYYVMFDSGVASGTEFCGPESAPITDPSFWSFNIWDPGFSSPGTNATTAPTTGTITTRPVSTTTINTMLTTTGIVLTTPTTVTTTTTTSVTTTTSDTTSTATTSTTSTTPSTVNVMYPQDLEKECQQPILITSAASAFVMVIIHSLGTFAAFTKFATIFNPKHIQVRQRYTKRMSKLQSYQ